jgi:hypothetical protein
MLKDDDFVVIVPVNGAPILAIPGEDLSPYVAQPFTRLGKMVALKDGRTVSGSVFRGRETTAADEIRIIELLNKLFVKPPE